MLVKGAAWSDDDKQIPLERSATILAWLGSTKLL